MNTTFSIYNSPLGPLTLAFESGALAGLWLDGQKHFGANFKICQDCFVDIMENSISKMVKTWLDDYFLGKNPKINFPISFVRVNERTETDYRSNSYATPFRMRVWRELSEIPYGNLTTYGELSRKICGSSAASRAVGGAVGANPIAIVVPCHRVVGGNSTLTGFAGGVEAKRFLLDLEGCGSEVLRSGDVLPDYGAIVR